MVIKLKLNVLLNRMNYKRKTLWRHIVKNVKEGNRQEAERLLVKYKALTRAKRTLEDAEK
jgi:hypothetical protein